MDSFHCPAVFSHVLSSVFVLEEMYSSGASKWLSRMGWERGEKSVRVPSYALLGTPFMTASHCSICASDTGPSESRNGCGADSVCNRSSFRSRFVAPVMEDPGCWLLWVDILQL